ncbi:hypothetical protein [Solilutibacter tolerans]|uniref:Uncharacterized protein n=1 Tax=Solilutibacter tolerans TaxID=1604334 RepID=A0A1N6TBZ4_9GAMM|nr:hypothetical protein [Lysobacter tolerans]SIQ50892.1 hypothetical protein SAMN05421546_1329 [Lysobacter tolerans]
MKACYLMIFAGMLMAGSALAQQPDKKVAIQEPKAVQAAELPAESPLSDHHCLRYTGSLVTASRNQRELSRPSKAPKKPGCAPASGRAWSRDDLERTGASSALDALRMLDPSVF